MSRYGWLAFAAVAIAVTAWASSIGSSELRSQLTVLQFWWLEGQFALLLALTCACLPSFVKALAPTTTSSWLCLGLIAGGTMVVATSIVPLTNRIYFDEHIYEGIGQNLADRRAAQICLEGSVEGGRLTCQRGEYNKEPSGYPYLLSVGYRLFGVSEMLAHRLNVVSSGALTMTVFFIAMALYSDQRAALFAAAIAGFIPEAQLWSRTAAVEPTTALMSTFAVLTACAVASRPSVLTRMWVVSATVFATQFRTESLLVVPVVLLTIGITAPSEFRHQRVWWALAFGLVLGAAQIGHLAAVRAENWGTDGPRMALRYFLPNVSVNLPFFFNNARFPVVCSVLALAGLAVRPTLRVLVPASMFAVFCGVFLFFYAGSYEFGADVRFSVLAYPGLALLAGRGASQVEALIDDGSVRRWLGVAVIAGLFLQFVQFLPQLRAVGEESWEARGDVEFVHQKIAELPNNSIVLTHTPSLFLVNGVDAAQMSTAANDPAYVASILSKRYAGGVFMHWNAWCGYTNPTQQAFCDAVLNSFSSTPFREHRERDFRFAFYRLVVRDVVPVSSP